MTIQSISKPNIANNPSSVTPVSKCLEGVLERKRNGVAGKVVRGISGEGGFYRLYIHTVRIYLKEFWKGVQVDK